jgi:hypothetical protein
MASANGWKAGAKCNVAAFLSKMGYAVQLPGGWVLTEGGRQALEKNGLVTFGDPLTPLVGTLSKHAAKITEPHRSQFLAEAIECVRGKHFRAAIVLSWIGALSLIYHHVLDNKLSAFNAEAMRRRKLKSAAKTVDDLATIKESDFLDICEAISLVTKSAKKELKNCLDRRNTAGHPNSHIFREPTVAAHIDTLIAEAFEKF